MRFSKNALLWIKGIECRKRREHILLKVQGNKTHNNIPSNNAIMCLKYALTFLFTINTENVETMP
jgi:hypothetical protein